MTLVDQEEGTLALRPHPGVDVNGWGSTWYAQAFLPGAVLQYTDISGVEASKNGIRVVASGNVSQGESSSYGVWESDFNFRYDKANKQIYGIGNYSIVLDSPLGPETGDLNLYKIASNYLDDVPLQSGGVGDTGDMNQSIAVGDQFNYLWIPPENPSFFPQDETDYLCVEVTGAYNEVDTEEMGYNFSIAAAYKPTIVVNLTSLHPDIPMIFGAFYDVYQSQSFEADNVGITPLILKESQDTEFDFRVEFFSEALPGDA